MRYEVRSNGRPGPTDETPGMALGRNAGEYDGLLVNEEDAALALLGGVLGPGEPEGGRDGNRQLEARLLAELG